MYSKMRSNSSPQYVCVKVGDSFFARVVGIVWVFGRDDLAVEVSHLSGTREKTNVVPR